MKRISKLYAFFILIAIPVLVISSSLNLTFRTSEIYSFYFNESQSINYTTLSITPNELSDQLSDFANDIFGDEVEITENAGYTDDPIFSDTEAEILFELREFLTSSLIFLLASILITILMYILLLKTRNDKLLFTSCQLSLVLSAVGTLVVGILIKSKAFRASFYATNIGIKLKKDSVLLTLFSKGDFWGTMDLAYILFSIIMMILIWYITWKTTKPSRIFNRR